MPRAMRDGRKKYRFEVLNPRGLVGEILRRHGKEGAEAIYEGGGVGIPTGPSNVGYGQMRWGMDEQMGRGIPTGPSMGGGQMGWGIPTAPASMMGGQMGREMVPGMGGGMAPGMAPNGRGMMPPGAMGTDNTYAAPGTPVITEKAGKKDVKEKVSRKGSSRGKKKPWRFEGYGVGCMREDLRRRGV